MQIAWLSLAVAGTVGYHLVLKLTPPSVNPLLSLAVTYGAVAVLLAGAVALVPSPASLGESLGRLNWTVAGLAAAIIALDIGFLMLYRSGFEVSLGQVVSQAVAALLLIAVGVAFFRERLSFANLLGLAMCIAGLWLINRR